MSGLRERGVLVRAGAALGAEVPALRVTYGLPEENARFLDALTEVLGRRLSGPSTGGRRCCDPVTGAFTGRPRSATNWQDDHEHDGHRIPRHLRARRTVVLSLLAI